MGSMRGGLCQERRHKRGREGYNAYLRVECVLLQRLQHAPFWESPYRIATCMQHATCMHVARHLLWYFLYIFTMRKCLLADFHFSWSTLFFDLFVSLHGSRISVFECLSMFASQVAWVCFKTSQQLVQRDENYKYGIFLSTLFPSNWFPQFRHNGNHHRDLRINFLA